MQSYIRQQLATAGLRIYDRVPPDAVFPYCTVGVVDGIEDFIADCAVDWEATAEIHIWAREPGYVAGKTIAVTCYNALAERHPVFPGFRVGLFALRNQRWLRDPDGLTSHGVLEYRANYGPLESQRPAPIPASYLKIWADEFDTFSMRSGGPTYAGLAGGTGIWTPTHHTTFDPKGSYFSGDYAFMVDPTYPWGGGYPALGQFALVGSTLRIRGERTPAALQGQLPINPVTGLEFSWVSGAMTTYESLNIGPPCYIETRVKLPRGKALWPAFWHVGMGNWPAIDHQEIDNVEQYQIDQAGFPLSESMKWINHGTLVRVLPSDPMITDNNNADQGRGDLSLDWHTWGMHFTNDQIAYYLDNVLIWSQITPALLQNTQVNLIYDLDIGGGAPGIPDASTPSPNDMFIDWVRIWAPNTSSLWKNGI